MTKWEQPTQPPPPMFLGEKERNLVKQVNDEIIERVVGQQIVYYPIDIERTNYHPLYGEALVKNFLPPVRVYALVVWNDFKTGWVEGGTVDKQSEIVVNFHKRRLTEDQDLFVREGDFVLYGDLIYELAALAEPRQLFGQIDHRFEISGRCILAERGQFDGLF